MAKLDSYKGSVDLISGLRPKNNGDFPLMQAHDIQVDEEGTRLDEKLENMGGAKSWNDLEDRPFGDETISIEWDGNTEGKVTAGDGVAVKVSDLTPEPEDLVGGVISDFDNNSFEITADVITDMRSQGVNLTMVGEFVVLVVYEDALEFDGVVLPEKGMYIVTANAVSYLTYGSIKKIDQKYLPESDPVSWNDLEDRPFGEENVKSQYLSWDGTPTNTEISFNGGTAWLISDEAPTASEMGYTIMLATIGDDFINNTVESANLSIVEQDGVTLLMNGTSIAFVIVYEDNFEIYGVTIPKKGTYASIIALQYLETNKESGATKVGIASSYNFTKILVHKIDEKYLPDDIGSNIITADSVDDLPTDAPDGTIALVPSESNGIPVFDLAAMGLETIAEVGKDYYLHTDVTELRAAMAKGQVTLTAHFFTEESSITVTGKAMHLSHTDTYYLSETAYIIEGVWVVISFAVLVDQIWVTSAALATQTLPTE